MSSFFVYISSVFNLKYYFMSNQVNLSGVIKKVFPVKGKKPTTEFVVRTKRFNSTEFDEVLCSADTEKVGRYIMEDKIYDLIGYVRTDSWPVDDKGEALDIDKLPRGKDGKLTKEYKWKSKQYCVITNQKEISLDVVTDRIEHAKAILSGSVTF